MGIDLVGTIERRPYKRLTVGDFEVLKELTFEEAKTELTAYFSATVGQLDLKDSPHAGRPVEDVVANLLTELFPSG